MFEYRKGRDGLVMMIFMIIAGFLYLNISGMLRKEKKLHADEEMVENVNKN